MKRDIFYFTWDNRDETIKSLELYLNNLNENESNFDDIVFHWSCEIINHSLPGRALLIRRTESGKTIESEAFFQPGDCVIHDGNIFRYINKDELVTRTLNWLGVEYEVNYINIREYFRNEKINNILSL